MKRFLYTCVIIIFVLGGYTGLHAQKKTEVAKTPLSATDKLAQKRTQRMKDELFLSQDQDAKILEINKDMLVRLDVLKQQKLVKEEYKKHFDQIENSTKNKIVDLLTPAQRQRFETKLFTEIYQTRVNKKSAVSVNRKR